MDMAGSSPLAHLHPELLSTILDYVVQGSLHPFPNICLVNRHFNNVALRLVKRKVSLNYNRKACEATLLKISSLLNDDILLSNIRSITVYGQPPTCSPDEPEEGEDSDGELTGDDLMRKRQYNKFWKPLEELLCKASGLKSLSWLGAGVMPKRLIEVLQRSHPAASLKVGDWTRQRLELDHSDADELALALSPNLVKLHTSFNFAQLGFRPDMPESAFFRVVATAPNLKRAMFIRNGLPPHYQAGEVAERRRQASPFNTNARSKSIRELTLDGFRSVVEALKFVEHFVDLSQLEAFMFSRGGIDATFFREAPTKLPNLLHLAFNFRFSDPEMKDEVNEYLKSCKSLVSLSLWSWLGVVHLPTILRHGSTLRKLELHEREEREDMMMPRTPLSLDQVKSIRSSCSHLRDLTIDLDMDQFDKENPLIYEELSKFDPPLQSVQIYFDVGLVRDKTVPAIERLTSRSLSDAAPADMNDDGDNGDYGDDADHSDVDEEDIPYEYERCFQEVSNKELLSYLHNIWKSVFPQPKQNSKLDVKFGEWERAFQIATDFEHRDRMYFQIRLAERDDQKDKIMVNGYGSRFGTARRGKPDFCVEAFPEASSAMEV